MIRDGPRAAGTTEAAGAPADPLGAVAAPAELRPRLDQEVAWCRMVRQLWPHIDQAVPHDTSPEALLTPPAAALVPLGDEPPGLSRRSGEPPVATKEGLPEPTQHHSRRSSGSTQTVGARSRA